MLEITSLPQRNSPKFSLQTTRSLRDRNPFHFTKILSRDSSIKNSRDSSEPDWSTGSEVCEVGLCVWRSEWRRSRSGFGLVVEGSSHKGLGYRLSRVGRPSSAQRSGSHGSLRDRKMSMDMYRANCIYINIYIYSKENRIF